MKKVLPLIVNLLIGTVLFAQQDLPPGMYKVNPLHDTADQLARIMYKYPAFKTGRAVFTDGTEAQARFNFHLILSEFQFITPDGDTLALNAPEKYKYVLVDTDTIYVTPKGAFWQVERFGDKTLLKRELLRYMGSEKKGAYGGYSSGAAITSVGSLSNQDNLVARLKIDENMYYKTDSTFFIMDKFRNVLPATKKSFYNGFAKKEKALRQFLDTHPVDFHSQSDLTALLRFLQEQ